MTKTIFFPSTIVMLLLALALFPALASAQIQVQTSATGSVGAEVDASEESEATSSEALIEINEETEADAETDGEATDTSTDMTGEADLMLNANGLAISVAAEVSSEEDLEVYQNNVAVSSEAVASVRFSEQSEDETRVEVDYEHSGRLFGIMPVTVNSKNTVTAYADGTVAVEADLPWWSVMVTHINYDESEITSSLQNNPTIMAGAGVELSAQQKAEIAEAIIAELDAYSQLSASTNN